VVSCLIDLIVLRLVPHITLLWITDYSISMKEIRTLLKYSLLKCGWGMFWQIYFVLLLESCSSFSTGFVINIASLNSITIYLGLITSQTGLRPVADNFLRFLYNNFFSWGFYKIKLTFLKSWGWVTNTVIFLLWWRNSSVFLRGS